MDQIWCQIYGYLYHKHYILKAIKSYQSGVGLYLRAIRVQMNATFKCLFICLTLDCKNAMYTKVYENCKTFLSQSKFSLYVLVIADNGAS